MARVEAQLEADQLRSWKQLRQFRQLLVAQTDAFADADPRRTLLADDYFSLFLFGLLNPVFKTMRSICGASHFERMRQVCQAPVSPASFSDAQHAFDPETLVPVVRELAARARLQTGFGEERVRQALQSLTAVDGTVLRAVNRMSWAPHGGHGCSVKLHLHFSVFDQVPVDWTITPGSTPERKVWKHKPKAGDFFVADRHYSHDHLLVSRLHRAGVGFVLRLNKNFLLEPVGPERTLSAADRQSGVVSDRLIRLGGRPGAPVLRLVRLETARDNFLLLTTREDLPAELIGLIYRYRWQIELFFKWIKTILGCGHWLAESPRGVAIQIYSVLIAALLLMLWSGRRPTLRQMEALRAHWLGFISQAELRGVLALHQKNN
jgi:hypothetical protein